MTAEFITKKRKAERITITVVKNKIMTIDCKKAL